MNFNTDECFLTRLKQYPHLRERIETLLNIVDDVSGDCAKADAAEQAILDEVRKLGQAALQGWAERTVHQAVATVRTQHPTLQGSGEKKSGGTRCLG